MKHVLAGLAGAVALCAATLAQAAGSGSLFVSSEKDDAVYRLNGTTYQSEAKIATAERPRHMMFSRDRKLIYVACGEGNSIDVIDIAQNRVVRRYEDIDDPELFDLGPEGKRLYISLEEDSALGILELESGEMVAEIEVGDEPEGVLVGPGGKQVYVTSEVANLVHVIDIASEEIVANITGGNRPRRFALSPDQKELWVTNELSGDVSIIDVASNAVTGTIAFAPKGFRPEQVTPVGLAMSQTGGKAFVALGRANHVAVVDRASRQVEKYILVGKRAWNLTFDRGEKRLFVANGLSDDVSVIDVADLRVTTSFPVGRVPHTVLIDD